MQGVMEWWKKARREVWRLESEGEAVIRKFESLRMGSKACDEEGHQGRGPVKNHRSRKWRARRRSEKNLGAGSVREAKSTDQEESGELTECNQCSAEDDVSLRQSVQRKKKPSGVESYATIFLPAILQRFSEGKGWKQWIIGGGYSLRDKWRTV